MSAVKDVMELMAQPMTGIERLRLFAALPGTFVLDEDAAVQAVDEIDDLIRGNERVASLESLRPHWAQGYTSDSIAAQASTAALSQVWEILGVDNQTAAMQKLRKLVEVSA